MRDPEGKVMQTEGLSASVQPVPLSTWKEIEKALGELPPPQTRVDGGGEVRRAAWAFRGLKDSRYNLTPTIERNAKTSLGWMTLESIVIDEFKSRARMHTALPFIPEDEMSWLALMQHYSVPTRLLDFTYSPFVALHFAVQPGQEDEKKSPRTHIRLWAIDTELVNSRFIRVVARARTDALKRKGKGQSKFVSFAVDDFASEHDSMKSELRMMRKLIVECLAATGTLRRKMSEQGCVCAALPPAFNPRLASQQGLFLLNFAESLKFEESLARMMPHNKEWCQIFDVPVALLGEVEKRLFQMNVHQQSLFPDLEGLAGLIQQKIRLQWT